MTTDNSKSRFDFTPEVMDADFSLEV